MSKNKKGKSRAASVRGSNAGSASAGAARKPGELITRRSVIQSAAVVGTMLVVGAGIHMLDTGSKAQHDLSVIGGGKPVVVQVHDPSCPSCRQLKRATESALKDTPQIEYRIADLNTKTGREMAEKYGVGKVTLLLFDARGKHQNTIAGVQPVAALRSAFEREFLL